MENPSKSNNSPQSDENRSDTKILEGIDHRTALAATAVAASLTATAFATPAFAEDGSLKVGAGKCAIAIAIPAGSEFSTTVDPLFARVLIMDNGTTRVTLLSLDFTSLGDATLLADYTAQINTITATPSANVVIYSSHNFSSPHIAAPGSTPPGSNAAQNLLILQAVTAAIQTAATAAFNSLQPAKVGAGEGHSKLAVNRNELGSAGWWLGFNDTEYSDPRFSVLRFDDVNGNIIAVLTNVNVQPSVLDTVADASGEPVLSADLAGAICTRLESYYDNGMTALFLPGAGGDQAPIFKGTFYIYPPGSPGVFLNNTTQDEGVSLLNQIGGRLTADVVRVLGGITTATTATLKLLNTSVTLTGLASFSHQATAPVSSIDYTPGVATPLDYTLIAVGDAVILGTAPELSASLGASIRTLSPFKYTLIGTLVGGALKYLPTYTQYEQFTYEAQEAPFVPGSGEIFVEEAARELQTFKNGR